MRRERACWLLLLLGGCKSVDGWWDLTTWQVDRGSEQTIEAVDAGFMLWQESSDYGFHLQLRYTFDPMAYALMPIFDIDNQEAAVYADTWEGYPEKDEPLMLVRIPTTLGYESQVGMFIEQFRNGHMVLVSAPADDDTIYTWTLLR